MNVNLLITDNNFTATNIRAVQSKPAHSKNDAKFTLNPDNKHSQVNNHEKPTTDNVAKEVKNRQEAVTESPDKFTQSTHKKAKSENTHKSENKTKPKEQIATSDTNKQPSKQNLRQSWLTENSVAVKHSNPVDVEHSKEGASPKIELKAGRQLAQIITNKPAVKPLPVTGHAVKSAEIKLLYATEKGQLGIKTVLPATSNGQNGLKAVLPDTLKNTPLDKKRAETANNKDKASILAKTITETKSATAKKSTTELAPEIPTTTAKTTNVSTVKQTAENINLTGIQAKIPEVQPEPARINPEKAMPTNQTDAKANPSLKISNLSNPNGKEDIHTGNNQSENHNAQKLKIEAAQVTTVQTKDQSNSTSNKSTSQGFEQMLSQNNSQTVITEQNPVAAKNTTASNTPDQNSSSDVSTDIGKQVLESVQRSVSQQGIERQITVRLNPPELGKVLIKFQQQDSELTGLMEVSKTQTRVEIEQTLPQIIRNLADSGIHIKRLEVMLSNEEQSGQGTSGNQSLQSGGSQQQYSGNPGTPGNDMDVQDGNEWSAGNNSYENLSGLQESLITDGSINLLI